MHPKQEKYAREFIAELETFIGKPISSYEKAGHNGYWLKKGTNFGFVRYNMQKGEYRVYAIDYRKDQKFFQSRIDPERRFIKQERQSHYSFLFQPKDSESKRYALAVLKRTYELFP